MEADAGLLRSATLEGMSQYGVHNSRSHRNKHHGSVSKGFFSLLLSVIVDMDLIRSLPISCRSSYNSRNVQTHGCYVSSVRCDATEARTENFRLASLSQGYIAIIVLR